MTKDDVSDLLEYLVDVVPNFKIDNSIINRWFYELQQYDIEDVKKRVTVILEERKYPTLIEITRNLNKRHEKIDWSKAETLCQQCHKPVSINEYDNHYGRCLDVDYVIRKTEKWFGKKLTRKELFDMPENEFNERYNKLLHYIHDHTEDESEKLRIEFVFNPPSKEKAKAFLGGTT